VDLFLGVAYRVALADWTAYLYAELGALHHFDLRAGPATSLAFLLADLLAPPGITGRPTSPLMRTSENGSDRSCVNDLVGRTADLVPWDSATQLAGDLGGRLWSSVGGGVRWCVLVDGGSVAAGFRGGWGAELLFGKGRHPDADRVERELLDDGAAPDTARLATVLGLSIEEIEKRKQVALLALDFVFRPQVSLIVLWALGDERTRRVIERAHERAIATVRRWLGRHRASASVVVVTRCPTPPWRTDKSR